MSNRTHLVKPAINDKDLAVVIGDLVRVVNSRLAWPVILTPTVSIAACSNKVLDKLIERHIVIANISA